MRQFKETLLVEVRKETRKNKKPDGIRIHDLTITISQKTCEEDNSGEQFVIKGWQLLVFLSET